MQEALVWLPPTPFIKEPFESGDSQNSDAADYGCGVQILPRLQGEKWASVSEVVGFMMNLELGPHVDVLKGQQAPDIVQPSVHLEDTSVSVPQTLSRKTGRAYIMLRSKFFISNG